MHSAPVQSVEGNQIYLCVFLNYHLLFCIDIFDVHSKSGADPWVGLGVRR